LHTNSAVHKTSVSAQSCVVCSGERLQIEERGWVAVALTTTTAAAATAATAAAAAAADADADAINVCALWPSH
jgi:hypothetical protein